MEPDLTDAKEQIRELIERELRAFRDDALRMAEAIARADGFDNTADKIAALAKGDTNG